MNLRQCPPPRRNDSTRPNKWRHNACCLYTVLSVPDLATFERTGSDRRRPTGSTNMSCISLSSTFTYSYQETCFSPTDRSLHPLYKQFPRELYLNNNYHLQLRVSDKIFWSVHCLPRRRRCYSEACNRTKIRTCQQEESVLTRQTGQVYVRRHVGFVERGRKLVGCHVLPHTALPTLTYRRLRAR